jgi:hypothetical protein
MAGGYGFDLDVDGDSNPRRGGEQAAQQQRKKDRQQCHGDSHCDPLSQPVLIARSRWCRRD